MLLAGICWGQLLHNISGVLRSASFVWGEKEEWEFQAPVSKAAD